MNLPFSVSHAIRSLIFTSAFLLFAFASAVAQQQATDGATPLGLSPGAPAGSYPLSDFENVNLFNGSLNFALPLVKIGGRGEAGYPLMLRIDHKWLVQKEPYDGQPPINIYTPMPSWWTDTGWAPIYSMGRLEMRQGGSRDFVLGSGGCSSYIHRQTLTRLTFTAPDGTEYELRDQATNGQPVNATCTAFNRGTVFVTADGSAATFISDTDIFDYQYDNPGNAAPSGYMMLRDGTRFRVYGGNVQWMRDRNGNKLSFTYDIYQRMTSVTDSLNRQVTINYDAGGGTYQEITYKGFGGATRSIKVYFNYLTSVLRSDFTMLTNGQMFPELNGSGTGGYHNPLVVSAVELPNGKQYQFRYNSYAELTRVVLPTGGAIEYDYAAGLTDSGNVISGLAEKHIYRRCIERRVYSDGGSGSGYASKMTYSRPETTTTNAGYVTTDQYNASGTLLARAIHYFYGSARASFFKQPTEYPAWTDSREYKTETFAANGTTLLRRVEHTFEQRANVSWWGGTTATAPPNDVRIAETVTTFADTNQMSKQTFDYDDSVPFNNQNSVKEYDYGSGAVGSLVRETRTTYVTSSTYTGTSVHLRSLPTQVSIHDAGGTERARTTYEYDNYLIDSNHAALTNRSSISGFDSTFNTSYTTRGNVTRITRHILSGGSVSSYFQYDIAGNVTKIIDGRGNAAELFYADCFGGPNGNARLNSAPLELSGAGLASYAFVTSIKNSLNQWTFSQFDFNLGTPVDGEDVNGVVASGTYSDSLDRPTQVRRAAGTGDTNQTTFSYDDTNRVITTSSDRDGDNDNLLVTSVLYDQMGRTIETRQYEGGGSYIAVQSQYDALDRLYKTSNPFRPLASETPVWTTTAFDDLGRTVSVTTPDSAVVSTSYSGNSVTVTDQALKKRKSVTDALGRLKQVYDDPTGLNYQTSYDYDVLDNLVKVTQGTQQRFFMYDSLKRLIRARNPEQSTLAGLALSDTLTGNSAWSVGYQYDANGNLTQKTDARGVVSTYVYDALNRNTTIDYSDTASINPDVKWFYDGATNGKGRFWYFYSGGDLSTGSNVEHKAIDSYDALGRPLVQRQLFKLNGTWSPTYQISRGYNRAGAVTSQTYPSGHTVSYTYDAAGRTTTFSGNLGDGTTRTYSTNAMYSPFGGVSKEQFGTTTPTYHKAFYNIRGQLFDTRVSSVNDTWDWNRGRLILYYSSNHLWGQSGTDNNGNVLFAQNWIPPENATLDQADTVTEDSYTYDALNRLSNVTEQRMTAAGGWVWSQQFQQSYIYDRWGNRSINPSSWGTGINVKQFSVDAATNRLGVPAGQTGTMSYDNAGNLTTDTYSGVGARTYDAENRMLTAIDNTGQTGRYTYDAEGHRTRRQVASSQEEWQIYGMEGELVAEYRAASAASAPEKEYGYRNGQLLITASGRYNVALAANGATATASSTATGSGFSPTFAINGNYRGPWGDSVEGWNDNTPNSLPDWIQVDFAGSKTIDEISVFGLHDNYTVENTPTETQTFTLYGLQAFNVQYWNGSSWVTIPNGNVTGNNKVWRKFTFSPITTSKIRVTINAVPDSWSRVVEIQAFGTSVGGEKVQWLIQDQLGTPRMILDQTGSLANVKRHDYLPFGEELFAGAGGRTVAHGYASDGVRQQFTSKERDIETGLDYFGARYYTSIQGRFTGVDPLFIEANRLGYPQSWNLYAYTRNNPLRFIDPDGLEIAVKCQIEGGCQKTVDNLNNRKDAQFQTELKDGKLKVVGQVDEKKLSKSELALYQAITNTDTVATLEVVSSSDTAHFGYSALNNIPPVAGLNRIDQGDLNQLDQVVAGEMVAHEIMEAFGSKLGSKQGLPPNYQLSHAYADTFFGDVLVQQVGGLPEGAQMATTARATLNFRRLQTKVSVEITLTTPQPAQSLPKSFDNLQGALKVVKPEEKQQQ
ncbi:MAG TPA: RHS repeat-associated core domain-containing protein [Pyrinomonadaceae bacterium]|nr:RHS repeat-associated core domain-containing protein [Pyrinomonadaceae bacterium]